MGIEMLLSSASAVWGDRGDLESSQPTDQARFIALDFETANRAPASACALGLVRVETGSVVRRSLFTFDPGDVQFEYAHLHGFTRDSVRGAGGLEKIWPDLEGELRRAAFVVAHNATFDRTVLLALARRAGVRIPKIQFRCTLNLARAVWGFHPADLSTVARALGVPLQHHNPLSDAEASALIYLAADREKLARAGKGGGE